MLKTRLSEHLIGKGLIINKQLGFRPNNSYPQQAFRLVEYISEGFKVKRKTVAVFCDVAKAFDRRAIDELTEWLRLWRIEVNPEKLASIYFDYSSRKSTITVYQNSVLHRDLELTTISKIMKDASKRFYDIANSHSNPLLISAISYEPPQYHFCRRPQNVLLDQSDDLTVEVEKLTEVNKMAID
ncbi:hypothetical protein EVAR_24994_1 [Eumeta japonica]|uniref:RNA-directed DNA polymerase from transposon BS n=1 Tax=Eumeta variegata TaxID=151549 RepID=A0A4C1XKT2_EUMVA|nr:hypothetical protein EVAR_24994_1 [Eumeta japonica]